MTDAQERLVHAVSDDWTDEEHRIMAKDYLLGRTEGATAEVLDEACDRLEKKRSINKRWLWGLVTVMVVLSTWCVLFQGYGIAKMVMRQKSLLNSVWDPTSGSSVDGVIEGLSPEDQLLMFGNPKGRNASERWVALWESDPDNPAYYVEYAMAYGRDHGRLPKDFLEVTESIDPDNGWYAVIAAGYLADGAVQSRPKPRSPRKRGLSSKQERTEERLRIMNLKTEWDILDQAKMDGVIKLLEEASNKEIFTSHQKSLQVERARLLPEAEDTVSGMQTMAYMAATAIYGLEMMKVSEVIAAEAYRCEQEQDKEALLELVQLWDYFVSKMNESSFVVVDAIITKACLKVPLLNIREAAKVCGLPDLAARTQMMHEQMCEWFRIRQSEEHGERSDYYVRKAGTFHGQALSGLARQAKDPPVLTDEDLKPGRMVDHAFAGRLMSMFAWLLCLLIVLGIWAYRFRYGVFVRVLSGKMAEVLNARDWFWIIGGGLFVPWIYYLWSQFFSPFSARHEGAIMTLYLQPAGQYLTIFFMMIVASLLLVRWRLSKVLPFMDFSQKRYVWVFVLLCVLVMPMIGLLLERGLSYRVMQGVQVCGGAVVLWVSLVACMAIFGKKGKAVERVIVSRSFVPVFVWMSMIMFATMWVNHYQERYWFARDQILNISDEDYGFTAYEKRIHLQMKKEIQEILNSAKPLSGDVQ